MSERISESVSTSSDAPIVHAAANSSTWKGSKHNCGKRQDWSIDPPTKCDVTEGCSGGKPTKVCIIDSPFDAVLKPLVFCTRHPRLHE